jgi:hypothetical protein
MGRFLLVELEPEVAIEPAARSAVWRWITLAVGVRTLADLEVVSRATLDAMLLPAAPPRPPRRRKGSGA